MTTRTRSDENLVERDEVLYPESDMIDSDPHYNNFTTIQNTLRQREERKQTSTLTHHRSHSNDDRHRAIRAQIEPTSFRHYHSNTMLNVVPEHSSNPFTLPINIQSQIVDGHIFNLTRIVENIGYDTNTPFIRSPSNSNLKNVSALLNIVLKIGGAHGPVADAWRSRVTDDYFQRSYLEKYYQRSASMIQHNTMNNTNERTAQYTRARQDQKNRVIDSLVAITIPTQQMNNEHHYENVLHEMYGYDDADVTSTSSASTHSSFSEMNSYSNLQKSTSVPSILKKANSTNNISQNLQTKHHVTIREYPSPIQIDQPTFSSSINNGNNQILSDYQQVLHTHPGVHDDPNPEIVSKPNPDQVTYEQNISVRYLVPPTPPPPGPLIIREIHPPRVPTPPPLIIKCKEPPPPTPPPLILREAPPPPPPQQETTVVTRVLPPEPLPARRVIFEHSPPLPPKPQSIIIEKWLPYKPAPPREVIYERVIEDSLPTESEPTDIDTTRQRRHSAEFHSKSSRKSTPISVQRQSSVDQLGQEYITSQPSGTFDQLVWKTHRQILAMQRRGRQRVQAHQQWAANQWQQHANMFLQYPTQLTTPSLVIYHPPATANTTSYIQRQEYREQRVQYNPTFVYPFY